MDDAWARVILGTCHKSTFENRRRNEATETTQKERRKRRRKKVSETKQKKQRGRNHEEGKRDRASARGARTIGQAHTEKRDPQKSYWAQARSVLRKHKTRTSLD